MQQNLLKLSAMLRQLPSGLQLQHEKLLRFQFLQEVQELKRLYSQLLKKWRTLEECSVVLLVNRFPIAD